MKKNLFALLSCCMLTFAVGAAQTSVPTVNIAQQTLMHYGFISYNALLTSMPEYAAAREAMGKLRKQYAKETEYNEQNFKRMFTEFLQGQKEFPQNILLKRQQDLQEAMEKGIAFRQHCDSLIKKAETDIFAPVRRKLDAAIVAAGEARGYDFILNTDNNTCPFLNRATTEDATAYVKEHLQN